MAGKPTDEQLAELLPDAWVRLRQATVATAVVA